MSRPKGILFLMAIWCASQGAMAVERVFGVFPRYVIPGALATNVSENVFLPGALNLRFGMTREEVVKTCPSLEYDAQFGRKYFLRFTHPVILGNELKGIEFKGGYPKPRLEIVTSTVEWLLYVFGTPDTAFEDTSKDNGRFGLIWKRSDFAVACWFVTRESGRSFYAYLKLVAPTSNMDKILHPGGARKLPQNSPTVLASLRIWAQSSAQLQSKPPEPHAPPPRSALPAVSLALLEKYEVLIGEGLAGSGFVVRHRNILYGVCTLHQFEGNTPGSLAPFRGAAIQLDKKRAIRQKDVQTIPLRSAQPGTPALSYNPDFTLRAGEEVYVLGPSGGVELGMIVERAPTTGDYKSAQGPRLFTVRMAKAFTAAGGSGCPVVQKSTGAVVGVLLSADDSEKARVIEFETLCLR